MEEFRDIYVFFSSGT